MVQDMLVMSTARWDRFVVVVDLWFLTSLLNTVYEKLLVLVTLVLFSPQLSTGGRAICLPQDAPVSEFLQATLLKQLQAEYIANLTNTSCTNLNNPQLSQIQNAILKIEANNKQIDKTQADTTEAQHVYW